MKKLRLFDSLKLVLVTVACVFILNVAHADTSINSVIAYGKTEQSATPTPTNPVPIMTNNGVLKYRAGKNLFDKNSSLVNGYINSSGAIVGSALKVSQFIEIKPNTTYTLSGTGDVKVLSYDRYAYTYTAEQTPIAQIPSQTGGASVTFTTAQNAKYIRIQMTTDAVNTCQLELGSTATAYVPYSGPTGIYVDGLTETIRDSAGHTATAQMLLSVGDYQDEQNITTGAITRKVGVKVFDGTEDWEYSGSLLSYMYSLRIDDLYAESTSVTSGRKTPYCTHFTRSEQWITSSDAARNNIVQAYQPGSGSAAIGLGYNYPSAAGLDDFKAWLAEQYANGTPVIVVYPLKASAQTTESVATQEMTTAPVRQTAGSILGMPIEVVLGDGTREWVSEMITIATTRYNEEQFEPVQNRLSDAMDAVDDVVTRTMSQAQAIDTIATTKQTRPDEGCPAKYCLLVEDEDGTPHWYPIAGANGVEYVLPAGYTQLTYIQSDGRQRINTGYVLQETDSVEVDYKLTDLTRTGDKFIVGAQPVSDTSIGGFWVETYNNTNDWYVRYGSSVSANTYGSVTPTSQLSGTLAVSKNSFVVNGVKILTPDFVSMPVNPMTIFNRISRDGSMPNSGASAQISEVRVKNGNNIVHRYIAVRNSNNELGMYDTVSGQFFNNAGTGTFTAGPDM